MDESTLFHILGIIKSYLQDIISQKSYLFDTKKRLLLNLNKALKNIIESNFNGRLSFYSYYEPLT